MVVDSNLPEMPASKAIKRGRLDLGAMRPKMVEADDCYFVVYVAFLFKLWTII